MNSIFEQKLSENIRLINTELENIMKSIPDMTQKQIVNAMQYSLLAGGKRIRPVLLLEVCRSFGGDMKNALPFACAVEMIHTYSLIHDDLPCMDNDDLRRGMPTNHKKFGDAVAVLAGDALLNYSVEFLLSKQYTCDSNLVQKSMQNLYVSSGIFGMIGGQILDIQGENKILSVEEIMDIHAKKTGKLIIAAAKIGAILANASENDIKNVESFAKNLGLAFQVIDDVLDVCGNSENLGKSVGKDENSNKNTFISAIGLQESKDLAEKLTNDAIISLNKLPNHEFLINLCNFLLKRQY